MSSSDAKGAKRAHLFASGRTPPTGWPARVLGDSAGLVGGHAVRLLRGGDELFPAMHAAIEAADHEVWVASYILYHDATAFNLLDTMARAARRGVRVGVVVDGFGSNRSLTSLRAKLHGSGVELAVFRPLDRWYAWLQPGQLRRMHHKTCAVDGRVAFVGGINLIDDRLDVQHGATPTARLDHAIELRGPLVASVQRSIEALWTRATLGATWGDEALGLVREPDALMRARAWWGQLRSPHAPTSQPGVQAQPVRLAFVLRDNLRQRRAIERRYLQAMRRAQSRIDLISPYFYPGTAFYEAMIKAARRGVAVRVILQGKVDYPIAGLAARALYADMLAHGVRIFEYTPAFLHAKIALIDAHWSTVGSSNIDPMSLLLNLEANVVIDDPGFTGELGAAFEEAITQSVEIQPHASRGGWRAWLVRGVVATLAIWYLRLAGISRRY